ncbi:MAG: hypothetical protein JWO93_3069 [Micrococcaceae bacterium]|nr:hypothetical protein [Micrococcaceae bacterium]
MVADPDAAAVGMVPDVGRVPDVGVVPDAVVVTASWDAEGVQPVRAVANTAAVNDAVTRTACILGIITAVYASTGTWAAALRPLAAVFLAHRPQGFAVVLLFAQCLTLVVITLTPCHPDLHLGLPVEEVQLERDDGEP